MSNPMKRRKLHRAAVAAGGEVSETPVAVPATPAVVADVVEEVPKEVPTARRFRSGADFDAAQEAE